MLKLRRINSETLAVGASSAGIWETADGRFLIFREALWASSKFAGRRRLWQLGSNSGWDSPDDRLLHSRGLVNASFPTRRAALEALETAVYS